jgi:hypothetical protein
MEECGNRYWEGGAFCRTCGYLEGNVINDTNDSIYHAGCRPDCQEVWESDDGFQITMIPCIEKYLENRLKTVMEQGDHDMIQKEQWYQQELMQDLYEGSTGYVPSSDSTQEYATQEYATQEYENESMRLEEERKRQDDLEWEQLAIEEAIQEEEEWKQRELLREAYESEWTVYDEDYH